MEQFGLRIKIYIANCCRHPLFEDEDYFTNNPEYSDEVHTEEDSDRETYMSYSCYTGDIENVSGHLANTKAIGYSCIVVVLNTDCDCRNKMLRKILKAMKSNTHVHLKSKLIMATYQIKPKYCYNWTRDMSKVFFKKYFLLAKKYSVGFSSGLVLHPNVNKITSNDGRNKISTFDKLQRFMTPQRSFLKSPDDNNTKNIDEGIKNITRDDRNPLKDHICFTRSNVDNVVFMQSFINKDSGRGTEVDTLLYQVFKRPMFGMQKTLMKNNRILGDFRIIQTSTAADFYFYGINPSLAIIINNYYFTDTFKIRQGSDQDVKRIIRELKKDGIPYMVIQDCSREQLLEMMSLIERLDMSPLKQFMLYVMTHGRDNNILLTHDGQIDIKKEVVKSIQSNQSLMDVECLIVFNACRGNISPKYASDPDIENIKPTDDSDLTENVILMYSVPNGITSLRCPQHGCPYIISMCKHFHKANDLNRLNAEINQDLLEEPDFDAFESVPELVTRNPQQQRIIHNRPGKAPDVLNLIKSILDIFVNLDTYDEDNEQEFVFSRRPLFFVGGSIRRFHGCTISFVDEYLTMTLDMEECSFDDPAQLEECRRICKDM